MTIVSGPNMGGKTVTLKMAGLFVVMAGCGMHVPAVEATIGRFTRIFTDIGDEQSIAQNTSTFSAHLGRLAEIVAQADARSLILIDEIGSGTEPNAGAALAVALLERFIEVGACAIVTTHATELKLFGARTRTFAMRACASTRRPTRRPTSSTSVRPDSRWRFRSRARCTSIRAWSIAPGAADRPGARLRTGVAELALERTRTTDERSALAADRARLRSIEDGARKRGDALERERREMARRGEAQLADALRDFSAELERRAVAGGERARGPRVTRGQSELLGRTIDEIRAGLGIERAPEPAAQRPQPAAIAVGDRVRVLSLDAEGIVVEDYGNDAMIQLGALKMSVPRAT